MLIQSPNLHTTPKALTGVWGIIGEAVAARLILDYLAPSQLVVSP